MAFIVSSSNPGSNPFFPLTVEHLIWLSEKSSFISNLRRRIGCLFDLVKIVANDNPFINIPVFFTSSIFWTGAYINMCNMFTTVYIMHTCKYLLSFYITCYVHLKQSTVHGKKLEGKNLGEFGKWLAIHQNFPRQYL